MGHSQTQTKPNITQYQTQYNPYQTHIQSIFHYPQYAVIYDIYIFEATFVLHPYQEYLNLPPRPTNTGDHSVSTNIGNYSAATVEGNESIAIVTGKGSKAKGSFGCWIVLTERDDKYKIKDVKAFKVDGENIKSDTYYTLTYGVAVEVNE